MNRLVQAAPSLVLTILAGALVGACGQAPAPSSDGAEAPGDAAVVPADYLDFRTPGPVQTGGVQMIELSSGHHVWTKRFGNAPAKVLLLHGGPAATHEYMEVFESFFPQAGIEFYEYDQLGSAYSDQPDDQSLWTVERFVEEVDQVRAALGLDSDNFYLLGHSWGGILAMEYALAHQDHLKGLIISDMTADFERYAAYNAELRAELPPDVLERLSAFEERGDYQDPEYQELVVSQYYTKHILRLDPWPEPVERSFAHINQAVYEYMQGPSEFVPGGILEHWSVWDRLGEIAVPTLTTGARYDTMRPAEMEEMSRLVQNGRYLYCPEGSHMAMWDDQDTYMNGVISFIRDIEAGRSP